MVTMVNDRYREAFRFFLEWAGYSTPPGRVVCASELARAEATARERGYVVSWEPEDSCYCAEISSGVPCDCLRRREDNRRSTWLNRYESECQCEYAVLRDGSTWPGPEAVLASLGGICGATPEYRRLVGAELAREALSPEWERQARELAEWEAFVNIISTPRTGGR